MNLLKLQKIPLLITRLSTRETSTLFQKPELKVVKRFTQQDLDKFSEISGDFNYIHSDKIPAEQRKVHGALLNAIVAGIIGTQFPGGGTIVLEQKFSFPKPCRIEVDCEFFLQLQQERKISIILYECKQNNEIVFKGEAKLLITNKKN